MIAISARLAASRIHYAWVIIALTFIVIVVTAGERATTPLADTASFAPSGQDLTFGTRFEGRLATLSGPSLPSHLVPSKRFAPVRARAGRAGVLSQKTSDEPSRQRVRENARWRPYRVRSQPWSLTR